jgi:hypothetical protein
VTCQSKAAEMDTRGKIAWHTCEHCETHFTGSMRMGMAQAWIGLAECSVRRRARAAPHARSVHAAAACCRDPRGQPTQARVLAGRLHRCRQVLRVRCAAERPTATAVEMVSGLVLGCDAVRMSTEICCNTARHEAACCHTRACCIMGAAGAPRRKRSLACCWP